MHPSYSIVIRTLGTTGDKYRQMLDDIARQTVQPAEVIVALPDGYEPDHRLGGERIVRSAKGMVAQRACGIEAATSPYLLLVDDDLSFPPDFVERLFGAMERGGLDCVLAFSNDRHATFGQDMGGGLRGGLMRLRGAFTGQYFYSRRRSRWFDTIAATGGHRTFVNNPEGQCQTGCGQCCLVKAEHARRVRLGDEVWLESGGVTSYASYEDAVFHYKMFQLGTRTAYAQDTAFRHLDAGAGRVVKSDTEARRVRFYSIARNRTVFWYRFIWAGRRSPRNLVGGLYGMVNYALYSTLISLVPRRWPAIEALFRGYGDAFRTMKKVGKWMPEK